MTGVRSTGFVVSLGVLAFIVCLIAFERQFERSSRLKIRFDDSLVSLTDGQSPGNLPVDFLSEEEMQRLGMPKFSGDNRLGSNVVPALQVHEAETKQRVLPAGNPPTTVPAPVDATPVDPSPSDLDLSSDERIAAVREVIEHELAHAPREEREIWFDELKTLPAGVVRDLLQVRKQLRALPRLLGGMPEKLASADLAIPSRNREIAAEPASQKIRFNSPDYHLASSAIEAAVSQLRHNLANAATPGFKRLRVTLVDSYSANSFESVSRDDTGMTSSLGAAIHGEGCRVAPVQLDQKQGLLKKTSRQFDVAIEGDGFFVVQRGEKELLTRCGAFTLDRDRLLCLAVSDDRVSIIPPIAVPDDAREILISADGTVSFLKSGETTMTAIGNLKLARVASPSRLQPAGQTLFMPNENSGPAVLGSPMCDGFGELQQGFLEQSNVNFELELEEIEELTSIMKALPFSSSRPVTATGPHQTPNR